METCCSIEQIVLNWSARLQYSKETGMLFTQEMCIRDRLYANKATPIAIVEAKDANHSVSHGLQQAMTYAQMLAVKFAYSSHGEGLSLIHISPSSVIKSFKSTCRIFDIASNVCLLYTSKLHFLIGNRLFYPAGIE